MQLDVGLGRGAGVWTSLLAALESVRRPGQPTVLDCGGGSGTYAVPLAGAGADVTVLDISADALATLRRRADEAGVGASVHPVQGDAEALSAVAGLPTEFDLVLAHGILDVVDDLTDTFAGLVAAVRPGGLVSVLVGNPVAAVITRALAGQPSAALAELDRLDAADGTDARLGPEAVGALCTASGLVVEARQGVGVFSDMVDMVAGAGLDEPGAREALARLDAAVAARSPFTEIAARVHLLARRPAG